MIINLKNDSQVNLLIMKILTISNFTFSAQMSTSTNFQNDQTFLNLMQNLHFWMKIKNIQKKRKPAVSIHQKFTCNNSRISLVDQRSANGNNHSRNRRKMTFRKYPKIFTKPKWQRAQFLVHKNNIFFK